MSLYDVQLCMEGDWFVKAIKIFQKMGIINSLAVVYRKTG